MASRRRSNSLIPHLVAAALVLTAVGLWQVAGTASPDVARHWSTPVRSTATIWRVLWNPIGKGDFQTVQPLSSHVVATLGRWGLGFTIAVLLGVTLGFLMGVSRPAFDGAYPVVSAFRALPSAAIWPLCALANGYNYRAQVAVISFGALWPVLLSTARAVQGIPSELREVMRFMHLEWYRRALLTFRSALPGIFTGFELSAGIAFLLTVSVEWFWPANGGLGWFLSYFAENREQDYVIGGVLLVGFVGLIVNGLVRRSRDVVVWWEQRDAGRLSTSIRRLVNRRTPRVESFADERLARVSRSEYVTEALNREFGSSWAMEVLNGVLPPYVFPARLDHLDADGSRCYQRDVRFMLPGVPGRVCLFARSWILSERLTPEAWARIESGRGTIGTILRECERGTIKSTELERAVQDRQDVAPVFGKEGVVRVLVRTRVLSVDDRPCVLVQESFPTW